MNDNMQRKIYNLYIMNCALVYCKFPEKYRAIHCFISSVPVPSVLNFIQNSVDFCLDS